MIKHNKKVNDDNNLGTDVVLHTITITKLYQKMARRRNPWNKASF
jgi:hypothetical protein